jgi:hypothetical protein
MNMMMLKNYGLPGGSGGIRLYFWKPVIFSGRRDWFDICNVSLDNFQRGV